MTRLLSLLVALLTTFIVANAQQAGGPVSLGTLPNLAHDLGGEVFAIDSRTFEIRNFNYDGTGPAAFFWAGPGAEPTATGFKIPLVSDCSITQKLARYDAATAPVLRIEIPEGMTINDIGHLSVWCETARENFGHVTISDTAKAAIPAATGARQCGGGEEAFPVQEGWNCENLITGYQVRWKRDGANLDFELVGKVNPTQWLSFGVSGSQTTTNMDNSDVVIATEIDGRPTVFDYFINSRGQCSGGEGVCPDTTSTTGPGNNGISKVSGTRTLDTLQVKYTRPIAANEPTDRPFFVDGGRKTFIVWAIGPYNAQANLPQIHRGEMSRAMGPVSFDFARTPTNNCLMPIIPEEPKEKKELNPWKRPTMSNITDFTARIGPSGGDKGVAAVTRADSWGIAWYLSETGTTGKDVLIPTIAVERGKKYTFRVFGGNDAEKKAAFHPMYITNDPDGGFATKGPKGRERETVYAGIQITQRNDSGIFGFTFDAAGPLCEYKQPSGVDPNTFNTYDAYFARIDRSCVNSVPAAQAGVLEWTVPANFTEDVVYYHCGTHRDLGYKLVVFDEGKVNQERLEAANVVTAAEAGEAGGETCTETFGGAEVSFSGCRTTPKGEMRVLWRVAGDNLETMIVAKTDGYAGLGWGHSAMVPANAVIAYVNAAGAVEVGDFSLTARSAAGVTSATNQQITDMAGEVRSGEIAARFTRPLAGGADTVPTLERDGNADFIWAIGAPPNGGAPPFSVHTARGKETVNLAETGASASSGGGFNRRAFFLAHAILMGLAWALFTPAAIVIMRYFKKHNPTTFQLHRGLNSASVLFTLVAFIMGVVRGSRSNRLHLGIGVVVTILALLQAIGGALRPGKGTPNRPKFYWAHMLTGTVAYGLAVANMAIGYGLIKPIANVKGPWWLLFAIPLIIITVAAAAFTAVPGKFPTVEEEVASSDNPSANQAM